MTLMLMHGQALSKGKFACERMVLAAQQAGHLRSLRFDVDAAKAAAAAAQHETTLLVRLNASHAVAYLSSQGSLCNDHCLPAVPVVLQLSFVTRIFMRSMHGLMCLLRWHQGLIQESSGIMTASLAAGKAANVQHPAMGSDAAAPSGQAIEALMRTTEETHHQLAALLKPVSHSCHTTDCSPHCISGVGLIVTPASMQPEGSSERAPLPHFMHPCKQHISSSL